MKMKHTIIALGLVLISPSASAAPLILESQSRHGFKESVAKLKAQAKKHKWKIPKVYDMQATMKKFGYKVRPVTVVSVCNPNLAAKILAQDKHRHLSAMMPCRVSVYEKSDGKAYFARVNATALSKQLGKKAGKVMGAAGQGVEKILAPLLR